MRGIIPYNVTVSGGMVANHILLNEVLQSLLKIKSIVTAKLLSMLIDIVNLQLLILAKTEGEGCLADGGGTE